MQALIWNSEGFKDTTNHLFIQESIREYKLDCVALVETGRSNFSMPFLRNLAAGRDFAWFCLPPHGRSGGILVGVNLESFSVKNVDSGDFCIKFHLRSKDGFEWNFVVIYGAAQEANKKPFLAELVRICENSALPMLVGGDFNIIRRPHEKNKDNFNAHWPFVFNAIIESLNLREIVLSGRQFTWASRRDNPTFEKLDRVLASVEWEQKFPLVTVRALSRTGSDHTPLLINSVEQAHLGNKNSFSFELSWLSEDGFTEMIEREWSAVVKGNNPTEIWQNKIRHLRRPSQRMGA
jgi:hypothetical protein